MAVIDYSGIYDDYNKAKEQELQRQATVLQGQVDAFNRQRNMINQNYDNAKESAYSSARQNALGRTERLAAMGLGRGVNDAPSSGYGASLAERDNTKLNNTLNNINLERASKLTDVDNGISQAKATADANNSAIESEYAQKIAQIKREEQEAAQYNF